MCVHIHSVVITNDIVLGARTMFDKMVTSLLIVDLRLERRGNPGADTYPTTSRYFGLARIQRQRIRIMVGPEKSLSGAHCGTCSG